MSETELWELKEKAKWANTIEEKKNAIKELSKHGEKVLPMLQEISNVTVYEELRKACIEAFKAIKKEEVGDDDNQLKKTEPDSTRKKEAEKQEISTERIKV